VTSLRHRHFVTVRHGAAWSEAKCFLSGYDGKAYQDWEFGVVRALSMAYAANSMAATGGGAMAFDKAGFGGIDEFVMDATNISETLTNLAYLIRVDAEDPRMVREYALQAEERLHALASMLRCAESSRYVH